MKVLFFSPDQNPFKFSSGALQRTNLLLKACLSETDVDIFTFKKVDEVFTSKHKVISCKKKEINQDVSFKITRWQKWKPVLTFWRLNSIFYLNRENIKVINKVVDFNKYDKIVIRYLSKAVEYGLLKHSEKLIVDVDDLPTDQFKILSSESGTLSGKIRNSVLSLNSRYSTRIVIGRIYCSFFSNPNQLMGKRAVYLPNVPFYEDIECDDVNFSVQAKRIVFIGDFGHSPNEKGIDCFLKSVYSEIYNKDNSVEFFIGGKVYDPLMKLRWEKYPNVHVVGYVDDLKDFYEKSRVVVIPIYLGGGTNIKFLESAQMKRACITTKVGIRGFNHVFLKGEDVEIAESHDDFKELLYKLLNDEGRNKQIANNANKKVKANFSIEVFSETVKRVLLK